jgi:hypothetical protein
MYKFFALALMGLSMMGCAHYGQANLPPKTDFFVTTGDIGGTNYQPVALVASERSFCAPCGFNLDSAYQHIEEALRQDLVDKAKAAGANGIINLHVYGGPGLVANPLAVQTCATASGFATIGARGMAVRF